MKKTILTLLLGAVLASLVRGQVSGSNHLFMPPQIRQAYENGTRSWDGRPGRKFWQNRAAYEIEVSVEPRTRLLQGEERIRYYNNSPDTLKGLVLQVYQDIYRKGAARDFPFPQEPTEGVQFQSVTIDGQELDANNLNRFGTVVELPLSDPLAPSDSLLLEIEWEYYISPLSNREGSRDSTSAFIGYWYPRMAVYDDLSGWEKNIITGLFEFYETQADFDVRISLPAGFYVWATGELQNAWEAYPEPVRRRLAAAIEADQPTMILDTADLTQGWNPGASTWHFRAREVPDFAFAFSDHFLWDAAGVTVGQRRVLVQSVYPPEHRSTCADATELACRGITFFSEDFPGLPYPYPAFTSFFGAPDNSGGMEFPMMANDGVFFHKPTHATVIIHELFHTYAPFYLRIDETRYGWLDEGWADFATRKALDAMDIEDSFIVNLFDQMLADNFLNGSNLPLMTPTYYLNMDNNTQANYPKPSLIFGILEDVLGEALFKQCTHEFFARWRSASPTPYDLIFTFEDVSGRDLSWFWQPWLFEFRYPDLAIAAVEKETIRIENKGGLPAPIDIELTYTDGSSEHLHLSAEIWKDGNRFHSLAKKGKPVTKVHLLTDNCPDVYLGDNQWPMNE